LYLKIHFGDNYDKFIQFIERNNIFIYGPFIIQFINECKYLYKYDEYLNLYTPTKHMNIHKNILKEYLEIFNINCKKKIYEILL
jgi:hypothetical protein